MNNTHGGKRGGSGRHKSESPLTHRVMQRYTDDQLSQIKAAAAKDGVTISEYIRKQATEGGL